MKKQWKLPPVLPTFTSNPVVLVVANYQPLHRPVLRAFERVDVYGPWATKKQAARCVKAIAREAYGEKRLEEIEDFNWEGETYRFEVKPLLDEFVEIWKTKK